MPPRLAPAAAARRGAASASVALFATPSLLRRPARSRRARPARSHPSDERPRRGLPPPVPLRLPRRRRVAFSPRELRERRRVPLRTVSRRARTSSAAAFLSSNSMERIIAPNSTTAPARLSPGGADAERVVARVVPRQRRGERAGGASLERLRGRDGKRSERVECTLRSV